MQKNVLHPLTAIINSKQKNASKQAKMAALKWLEKEFPQAFDNTESIRPLKINIMDDILLFADKAKAQGVSRSKLREALALFTGRMQYLICLKTCQFRIDLQGNEVEPVSAQDADNAALKIKKRIEQNTKNAKKAAQATEAKTPQKPAMSYYETLQQERPPLFATEKKIPTKPVSISIKTKKVYDKAAIAQLREQLGLPKATQNEGDTTS